jgi:hypothetical protein
MINGLSPFYRASSFVVKSIWQTKAVFRLCRYQERQAPIIAIRRFRQIFFASWLVGNLIQSPKFLVSAGNLFILFQATWYYLSTRLMITQS